MKLKFFGDVIYVLNKKKNALKKICNENKKIRAERVKSTAWAWDRSAHVLKITADGARVGV